MKYNTPEVAALQPDYLGFIFWKPSKRFFDEEIPQLPEDIKKVGVFVDASIDDVLEKIAAYDLWGVQLHGNESPEFIRDLLRAIIDSGKNFVEIIKVFSIKNDFDFSILREYKDLCSYYLFDTKGKLPGGNGFTFNWGVLKEYPSTKPYFLSGGIGLEEIDSIKEFMQRPESKYCHAIDVNSRFEIEPGLKNIDELKEFKNKINFSSSP